MEFPNSIPRSTEEPGLNFFSSFIWNGWRSRFVGRQFYYRPATETFHEFLEYFAVLLIGEKWWQIQGGMKLENQHSLFQWANDYHRLRDQSREKIQESDGTFSMPMSGPILSWISLPYDLLCLSHMKVLPQKLLERLKTHDDFQGARYEIAVAAIVLRAGCNIEWVDPDNLPPGKKSCEFIATHRATGVKFGVEAKSKIRKGSQNEKGCFSQKLSGISELLQNALTKAPEEMPFVIFIDLNIPFEAKPSYENKALFNEIKRAVGILHTPSASSPDTFSLIAVTNFPFHYTDIHAPCPPPEHGFILPNYPKHAFPKAIVEDIWEKTKNYGKIPSEI